MAKNNSKKNKAKSKVYVPGIILIISTLVLGVLIVMLVAGRKQKITINGEEASRRLEGSYPTPAELMESDKLTYFPYMEIPDMIFNKMYKVTFGEDCPVKREDLVYMKVLYWGVDSDPHSGELIVNKQIAEKVRNIFYELYKGSYPIERIELVDVYGGNDEVSMSYNNTSCFNGRKIAGTEEWSEHAYGMAIDINPLYNPYVNGETVLPINGEKYADREKNFQYKINEKDYAYSIFKKYGFEWGGSWEKVKDYQHFEAKIGG